MGRQLMRITPSLVAVAREYLQLKSADRHEPIHVAECFPIRPEAVLDFWEAALFDLHRRQATSDFELSHLIVFKDGHFIAEFVPLNTSADSTSLFD